MVYTVLWSAIKCPPQGLWYHFCSLTMTALQNVSILISVHSGLLQRCCNVKCINLLNRSVSNCSDVTILHLMSGPFPSSVLCKKHVSGSKLFLILRRKIRNTGLVGLKIWKQQLFISNTSVPIISSFSPGEGNNHFRRSCVILRISLIICKHFQQIITFLGTFKIANLINQNVWKAAGKQNNMNPCNFHYFFKKGH